MPARILVVDDENTITCALDLLLCEHDYDVNTASTAKEAEALLARHWFDLVFLDLRLPDADGIRLLEHIKQSAPETEVVMMTAHGSLEVTIDAIKRGAFYYLESLSLLNRCYCSPNERCSLRRLRPKTVCRRARTSRSATISGSSATIRECAIFAP